MRRHQKRVYYIIKHIILFTDDISVIGFHLCSKTHMYYTFIYGIMVDDDEISPKLTTNRLFVVVERKKRYIYIYYIHLHNKHKHKKEFSSPII